MLCGVRRKGRRGGSSWLALPYMAEGSGEQGTLLSIPGLTTLPSSTACGGDVQMPPALFAGTRFPSSPLFKQGALVEGQT